MRLLKQRFERDGSGLVTMMPEEPEDMWHAYNLVQTNDLLRAAAVRRTTTQSSTGSVTSQRVHTTLSIRVQKIAFDTQASHLTIGGQITEETPYARLGQFHSLDLELHRSFTLQKAEDGWDSASREVLRQAIDPATGAGAWAVVMQEGVANVAVLTGERTVLRQRLDVAVPRKRGDAGPTKGGKGGKGHDAGLGKFYAVVMETLLRHMDLTEGLPVLLASPGFTAAGFFNYVREEAVRAGNKLLQANLKNWIVVHSSSGHLYALNEVLKSNEVLVRLKDTRYAREAGLLDDFMTMLRKDDGRACYGPAEVERAVDSGAVGRGGGVLLISNALFRSQDVAVRKRWVTLTDRVREVEGGEVRVLSSAHESGTRLEALGGIAAILTFPLEEMDEEDDGEIQDGENIPI